LRIADGVIHVVLDPLHANVMVAVHTEGASDSPGTGPGKTLAWTPPKPPRSAAGTPTATSGAAPAPSSGAPTGTAAGPSRATAANTPGTTGALVADAHGTYAGQPIEGHLVGGSVLALRSKTQPWPIDLRGANGRTTVHLHGTVADPLALAGARLRLALAGASLGSLSTLTGLALPDTPPYSLSGALDFAGHKIEVSDIEGRVGSSDLEGTLAVALGGPRPVLDATLQSRSVNLVDLGGFIGAKTGNAKIGGAKPAPKALAAKAAPGLLPNTPINVPRFRNADVHLRYHAGQIQGRSMPLDNLVAALDIVDGKVTVHPVAFGVGAGRIAITAKLDPTGRLLHTDAAVDFHSLDVARLMQATHTFTGAGTLSGSARLVGTGNSLAAIAADGDGALLVGMAGGNLSAVLVDLSGLEFGNALLSALGLPKTTDITCMVGNFALQHGILRTRAFIIDTRQAIMGGTGKIDMRSNTIDLTLRTAPKHFSIGSLPGPIHISGPVRSPRILPSAQTVARAGIAGALAAIFPPLAALPTIQFGTTDHHRCDALLERARHEAPGTRPPLPQRPATGH
ncbi:MAG TPA: AsmA family protein, partial [Acetobacteraceae bacterium]|nr:AsmA family protein [Acetobacteraceae bacterium]